MGIIHIDSFSGDVADLTVKQKRHPLTVLRVLDKNPMVSTWDMETHKLWRTIQQLQVNGWVAEEKLPYPWLKFVVTDVGKRMLEDE